MGAVVGVLGEVSRVMISRGRGNHSYRKDRSGGTIEIGDYRVIVLGSVTSRSMAGVVDKRTGDFVPFEKLKNGNGEIIIPDWASLSYRRYYLAFDFDVDDLGDHYQVINGGFVYELSEKEFERLSERSRKNGRVGRVGAMDRRVGSGVVYSDNAGQASYRIQ